MVEFFTELINSFNFSEFIHTFTPWQVIGGIIAFTASVGGIIQAIDAWESLKARRKKRQKDKEEKERENSNTPINKLYSSPITQKNWLNIAASYQEGDSITFSQNANRRQTLLIKQLPEDSHPDAPTIWQDITKTLFEFDDIKQAYASGETVHLRIMTDDKNLGRLPWHCLPDFNKPSERLIDNKWIIEVSPCSPASYAGYSHKNIDNPLIVIPANHQHELTADKHFSLVQSHLESELEIQGFIPRVNTPKLLLNEIKVKKPDFIYLYARYKQEKIILDADNTGNNAITLDELAQCLEQNAIHPLIVMSLLSDDAISDYPIKLIKNTSLLWMLNATHDSKIHALEDQLFNTLIALSKNPDISATIKQQSPQQRRLQSIVWNNQQTPKLNIVHGKQKLKRQFRVAVLKVVLGREELKDRISGGINRSLEQVEMLVYAISGTATACPCDVPAQIRHHMQFSSRQPLTFISHYFNIQIAPNPMLNDMEDSIDNAMSQSLPSGAKTIKDIFRKEIERRGLQQDCCIALNWYFHIPKDMQGDKQEKLSEWIKLWNNAICAEFDKQAPEHALLLHSLCFQLETQEQVNNAQKQVNKILGETQKNNQHCDKEYLRLSRPLDALESNEIKDFFNNTPLWRKNLQLDQHNIDTADFADWIHQQTQGDFEAVVNTIWQQFQHNYQEYKRS